MIGNWSLPCHWSCLAEKLRHAGGPAQAHQDEQRQQIDAAGLVETAGPGRDSAVVLGLPHERGDRVGMRRGRSRESHGSV